MQFFKDFMPILSHFQCYFIENVSNFMTIQCGADLISIADLKSDSHLPKNFVLFA